MKRVGFILKPDKSRAGELLAEFVPWLLARGVLPVVTDEDQIAPNGAEIVPQDSLGENLAFAVVLGGDGTMLRASHLVAAHDVPVLGINLGRLGFLTQFRATEAREAIDAALEGRLATAERSRLAVTYAPANGPAVHRSGLNDAVIHQGAMARLIDLQVWLDGNLVNGYRADGLIIATPTGSTAYNLAAGGPILMPGQQAMTITPICAHGLTNRPLVVPKTGQLIIRLGGESRGVVLTVDGQWARTLSPDDEIRIAHADKPLVLFDSDEPYFDILRQKLHWGRSPTSE